MSKFKKRIIIATVLVILLLAMPVSNLIGRGTRNSSIASIESDDDTFALARDVLSSKCADCHAEDYELPLYALLPGARNIIERDIQAGLENMDLARSLQPENGGPVSEVVIAKLEQSCLLYTSRCV